MAKSNLYLKEHFFSAVFWLVFMMIFNYLWSLKDTGMHFDLKFFVIWITGAVLMFLFSYFMDIKLWDGQKSLYEESIKYHKEHNPEILKELD